MEDELLRYDDIVYAAALDEWDRSTGPGTVDVKLRRYPILKRTPKGAWIDTGLGMLQPRFVLLNARKRFACPTEPEAMESFIQRKRNQLRILKSQVARVEKALRLIKYKVEY
jgi:hypothetical protein